MRTALRNVFIRLNPTLFTQLMKPDNNDIITEPHINNIRFIKIIKVHSTRIDI